MKLTFSRSFPLGLSRIALVADGLFHKHRVISNEVIFSDSRWKFDGQIRDKRPGSLKTSRIGFEELVDTPKVFFGGFGDHLAQTLLKMGFTSRAPATFGHN